MKIYEGCGNVFVIAQKLEQVVKICEQEETDGFILVERNPLKMTIYNRDGTLALLCVNGLRCFVHYCIDEGIVWKSEVEVVTDSGKILVRVLQRNPFLCEVLLPLPRIEGNHVYMGNHHLILWNRLFDKAFYYCKKYDCNVNYVRIINKNRIYVITYERGVGFTNSCGSGAIASVYYAFCHQLCGKQVEVVNKGGKLFITMGDQISLIGRSRFIRSRT